MPVLVYSLLRILLIVIAGAGLYLAGMRGLLLVVVAVLVGAALSYLVLDRYRQASAQWLQSRGKGHTRMEDRLEADAEAEDALLDEQEQREHDAAAHGEAEGGLLDEEPRDERGVAGEAEGGLLDEEPQDEREAAARTSPSDSDGQGDGKPDSEQ